MSLGERWSDGDGGVCRGLEDGWSGFGLAKRRRLYRRLERMAVLRVEPKEEEAREREKEGKVAK